MKKRLSKNSRKKISRLKRQAAIRKRFRVNDFPQPTPALPVIGTALAYLLIALALIGINQIVSTQTTLQPVTSVPLFDSKQVYASSRVTNRCQSIDKTKKAYAPILHEQVLSIVADTPMEKMAKKIATQDREVAAYLVGIAMKESKFGKFSPKKDGRECFNYWGYRGRENTTKSGYSCFDSPDHAVKVVGGKIASMLERGSRTPAGMISWKCGSTCAGHDPISVQKWIDDVAINYYKLNPPKQLARNR